MTNRLNGCTLPKLGYGIMRCSGKSISEIQKNIDAMMSAGFNYFEACEFYLNKNCENIMRQVLCDRYSRNEYIICDKFCAIGDNKFTNLEDFFQNQLNRCGVEYFDVYLIQAVDRRYEEIFKTTDILQFFINKKNLGLIKNLGFSYHDDAQHLEYFLNLYDWDCVQIQINVYDWYIGQAKEIYNILKSRELPILAMGPLKGGALIHLIDPYVTEKVQKLGYDSAELQLRFLTCLSGISLILTGTPSYSELQNNIQTITNTTGKITETEVQILRSIVQSYQHLSVIPCTTCGYCVSSCPKHINLPRLFMLYNQIMGGQRDKLEEYYTIQKGDTGSLDCLRCGKCAEACPQHLDTVSYINNNLFQLRL